ncbi:hypothetical protein QQF64_027130 [Cirrhinus molitorella]|uniref:Uncharacterized protein n=1 Tax=Cirrhinus molitorella TaxID=172907 RepID=A0ABR3NBI4_9TELE
MRPSAPNALSLSKPSRSTRPIVPSERKREAVAVLKRSLYLTILHSLTRLREVSGDEEQKKKKLGSQRQEKQRITPRN